MISIDANLIVRLLVRDDIEQADAARRFLMGLTVDKPGFICREVLVETVWVLERVYRRSRVEVGSAMLELIGSANLEIESHEYASRSLYRYMQGGVDFADLMILAAADHRRATPLYTFDRKFAQLEGVTLLDAP